MFCENWYSEVQLAVLAKTYRLAAHVPGAVVEIGCWEGRSTVALANACMPRLVHAIDHWRGVEIDGSAEIAGRRDIHASFLANVNALTTGNVRVHRDDWRAVLATWEQRIAFCHIDAEHDYDSVRLLLETLLPHLAPGAVLCGDDMDTAGMSRGDLGGGVERAVRDTLSGYAENGNFWFWTARA